MALSVPAVPTAVCAIDLGEFYASEYPKLTGILTLYCGDRQLALELAQEAMARACRHWSKVQTLDMPAAWVHRVGINLANSTFRRRLRRREHAAPAIEHHHDHNTAIAVRTAVSRLPRRQREALVLRYFLDLPVDQVATRMTCSPGTVKALTSQAIDNLRRTGALADDEEAAS